MTERLSKLQKWILSRILENLCISPRGLKRYWNKAPDEKAQSRHVFFHGLALTNSERVIRYRCIKNMMEKGLIEKQEGFKKSWKLTKKGFGVVVKANETPARMKIVSFKDYQKRLAKLNQEYRGWKATLCKTAPKP